MWKITIFAQQILQTHPSFAYIFQGLNYVAGMLLLVTNNEEDAFWLLKILTEDLLPNYYAPDIPGLLTDVKVLEELIRYYSPMDLLFPQKMTLSPNENGWTSTHT